MKVRSYQCLIMLKKDFIRTSIAAQNRQRTIPASQLIAQDKILKKSSFTRYSLCLLKTLFKNKIEAQFGEILITPSIGRNLLVLNKRCYLLEHTKCGACCCSSYSLSTSDYEAGNDPNGILNLGPILSIG